MGLDQNDEKKINPPTVGDLVAKALEKTRKKEDASKLPWKMEQTSSEEARERAAACLAILHIWTLLTGRGLPVDLKKGIKMLETMANTNDANVQYMLGVAYAEEKKYELAFASFKKAADQGHTGGIFELAKAYAQGRGVAVDEDESFRLVKQAAAKGHPVARKAVGG